MIGLATTGLATTGLATTGLATTRGSGGSPGLEAIAAYEAILNILGTIVLGC